MAWPHEAAAESKEEMSKKGKYAVAGGGAESLKVEESKSFCISREGGGYDHWSSGSKNRRTENVSG